MFKIYVLIILLTSFSILAQSTQHDSIIAFNQAKQEGVNLINKGKYFSAINNLQRALKIIPHEHLDRKIEVTYLIGNAYQNARVLDSANHYYQKADKLCINSSSSLSKSLKYHNKASLYFTNSKIDSAMVNAIKSLDYALLSKNTKQIVLTKSDIGLIFLSQKDYKNAHNYFIESLELAEQKGDTLQAAFITTYLGQLNIEKGNHEKAEDILKRAILVFEKKSNNKGIIMAKGHLSKAYFFLGKTEEAIKIGYELIPIMNQLEINNDLKKLISNTNAITEVEKNQTLSDSIKIETASKLVKENFDVIKNPIINVTQNKALAKYTEEHKNAIDVKNASQLSNENLKSRFQKTLLQQDSIYQASLNSKYLEIETKFKTEKKEKENLLLKQLNTEQELTLVKESKRRWLLIIGLISSLLTLFIFWLFYRKNTRQRIIIENLQKEMHHRVKNNLAIINSFIDVTKGQEIDINTQRKLDELQNRIDSINQVHSQLHVGNDVSKLNLKKYTRNLAKNITATFDKKTIDIIINIDETIFIHPDKSFPLGLIINEFLTNSFKHAFNDNRPEKLSIIEVTFICQKDFYCLKLSDNGCGLPLDFKISTSESFGIEVMELLSRQLKGTFSLNGNDGVTINIKFPKS
ncbi:tetratricopeptide repeat protein [uncultured Psychroserpens sp.]|uniref:tetratricopeptide repeat-containing sensor histidine kinase n=1 Tax=uncultured Psychroserpens sp. TaxID=255436 RepID=UPI00262E7535|nr:tetratricopeptide repeat protein [uncultured Psychroserpens sp.]